MDLPSVMLAAGGTGGHLFPAYALAEELNRRRLTVDLVTDMRGDRYGKGFPARTVYRVPSATLTSRWPWSMARTGLTLANGVRAAHKLLGEVQPGIVVGFGGHPTVPPLVAAYLRRIPTAIHEQNAVLGRANRLLAGRVTAIATSFEQVLMLDARAASKVRCTGNPVRNAVLSWARGPYRPPEPGGALVLLVIGGSQGARFFSDVLPPALARLAPDLRAKLKIVQQCRGEDLDRVRSAYQQLGIAADLDVFFANLPERMAAAHLVLGRAGASSVAELAAIGRPSILVPLPHAVDNDQLHNAARLAEAGGSWCIEQRDLTPERLAQELEQKFRSPMTLWQAAKAARVAGKPDAVTRLADLVGELLGVRK